MSASKFQPNHTKLTFNPHNPGDKQQQQQDVQSGVACHRKRARTSDTGVADDEGSGHAKRSRTPGYGARFDVDADSPAVTADGGGSGLADMVDDTAAAVVVARGGTGDTAGQGDSPCAAGGAKGSTSRTISKGGLIDAPAAPVMFMASAEQAWRILVWDFVSMYAMIFYILGLDPSNWDQKTYSAAELRVIARSDRAATDTLVWDDDNKAGYLFRRDPHNPWIKKMFADRTARRREIKKIIATTPEITPAEKDKLLEDDASLKLASNSVYGKMGAKYRLSQRDIENGHKECKPVALLVATFGRFMLRCLESLKDDPEINQLFGTRVVAKYTDSCVTLFGTATQQDVIAVSAACGRAIIAGLNAQVQTILQISDAHIAAVFGPTDPDPQVVSALQRMMIPDRVAEFSIKLEARASTAYFPGNKGAYVLDTNDISRSDDADQLLVIPRGIRHKLRSKYYRTAVCQLFCAIFRSVRQTHPGVSEHHPEVPGELQHIIDSFATEQRAHIPDALADYIHYVKQGQPARHDDDDITSRKEKRGPRDTGTDGYDKMIAIKPKQTACASALCDIECRGPRAAFVAVKNTATRWINVDAWEQHSHDWDVDACAMFDACFGPDIKRLALPVPSGSGPEAHGTVHIGTVLDPATRNVRIETPANPISRRVTSMKNEGLVRYLAALNRNDISIHEIANLLLNKVYFDFEKDLSKMSQDELAAYLDIDDGDLSDRNIFAGCVRRIDDFITAAERAFPCLCNTSTDGSSSSAALQIKDWRLVLSACSSSKLSFHVIWGVATRPALNKAMALWLKTKCNFPEIDTGVYSSRHSIRLPHCAKSSPDGTFIDRKFLAVDDSTAPDEYSVRRLSPDELRFSFISDVDSTVSVIDSPLCRVLPHPVAAYIPAGNARLICPNAPTAVPEQILDKISAFIRAVPGQSPLTAPSAVTVTRIDPAGRFHLRPTNDGTLCPFCNVHHDNDNWLLTVKSSRPYAPAGSQADDISLAFTLSCVGHQGNTKSSRKFRLDAPPAASTVHTEPAGPVEPEEDWAEYGPPPCLTTEPDVTSDHVLSHDLGDPDDIWCCARTHMEDESYDVEDEEDEDDDQPQQGEAETETDTRSAGVEEWRHGQETIVGYALALPGQLITMQPDPELVTSELYKPSMRDLFDQLDKGARATILKKIGDSKQRKDYSAGIGDILRVEANHLNATRPTLFAEDIPLDDGVDNMSSSAAVAASSSEPAVPSPAEQMNRRMRRWFQLHRAKNKKYVKSRLELGKIVTFSAMMGLGKTTSLIKLTSNHVANKLIRHVVVFTPRITLSHDDIHTFTDKCKLPAGHKWELYSDIDGSIDMVRHPFVIIQVDSASRLDFSGVNPKQLLVIYDEVETDLTQLSNKPAFDTFQSFISPMLIGGATCFIPDAFLSDTTRAIIDIIAESVRAKPVHIRDYRLPDAYTYFVHAISSKCKTEVGRMTQIILDKAGEGKRIYVPCAFSGIATTIHTALKDAGIKTILFSGDNEKTAPVNDYEFSAENREIFADLLRANGVSEQQIASGRVSMAALKRFAFADLQHLIETEDIRVVITTTTLCCGVSVDHKDLFDSVVGLFGMFADSKIQIQMLERIRNYSAAFGHLFVCMDTFCPRDPDRGDKTPVSHKSLLEHALDSGYFPRILSSSGPALTALVAKLASDWGQRAGQERWLEMFLGALLTTGACIVPVPRCCSFSPYHTVSPSNLSLRAVASFATGAIAPPPDIRRYINIAFPSGRERPSSRALQASSYAICSEMSSEAMFLAKIVKLMGLDAMDPVTWTHIPVALALAIKPRRAQIIATKLFFFLRILLPGIRTDPASSSAPPVEPGGSSAALVTADCPPPPIAAYSPLVPQLNRDEFIEIFTMLLMRMLGSTAGRLVGKVSTGDSDTYDIIKPSASHDAATGARSVVQMLTTDGTPAADADMPPRVDDTAVVLATDDALRARMTMELRHINANGIWTPSSERIRAAVVWLGRQNIRLVAKEHEDLLFSTPLGPSIQKEAFMMALDTARPIIDRIITLAMSDDVAKRNSGSAEICAIHASIVRNSQEMGYEIMSQNMVQRDLPKAQQALLGSLHDLLLRLFSAKMAVNREVRRLSARHAALCETVARQNKQTQQQSGHHTVSKKRSKSSDTQRIVTAQLTRAERMRDKLITQIKTTKANIRLINDYYMVIKYRDQISKFFAFFSPFLCATGSILWAETTNPMDVDRPTSTKNPVITHRLLTLHTI